MPQPWTHSCNYWVCPCKFRCHFNESPLEVQHMTNLYCVPSNASFSTVVLWVLWNTLSEGFLQVLMYKNKQVIRHLSIVLCHFLGRCGPLYSSEPHSSNLWKRERLQQYSPPSSAGCCAYIRAVKIIFILLPKALPNFTVDIILAHPFIWHPLSTYTLGCKTNRNLALKEGVYGLIGYTWVKIHLTTPYHVSTLEMHGVAREQQGWVNDGEKGKDGGGEKRAFGKGQWGQKRLCNQAIMES